MADLANVDFQAPRMLGRYEILGTLGRGGMATVHLARAAGEAGFQRLFAIKVLHPHLADDAEFVTMLLDEARIAARLHHPNVVPIVDLGTHAGIHYVVMEYVEGCSLWALLRKYRDVRPPRLLVPIVLDALAGLHAAHSLTNDEGEPLNLVHRDVSPQNILVGVDGTARITDFGIARAESRINSTRPGQVKGKIAYLAPEQIRGGALDARTDVFSAGGMLWCALTGRKLFHDTSDAATMTNILDMVVPAASQTGLKPDPVFDAVCARALERDPNKRFATAQEMEDALREATIAKGLLGSRREVSEWVKAAFAEELSTRRKAIRQGAPRSIRDPDSSASSISGFRAVDLPSITPSGPDWSGSLHSVSEPPTLAAELEPRKKRTGLLVGAALVFATLIGVVVFAATRTHESAGVAPSAQAPAPPTASSVVVVAAPTITATEAPRPQAIPTPTNTTPAARPVVVWRPPPQTTAKKPEPPPPATTAAKPWDKDSPLPPP